MKHPTALVAYNRPHCVQQTIDALREAEPEPLYVFCDGPKDNLMDIQKVENVRDLVRRVDWTDPVVVESETHLGLARSVVGATDYVLALHETVIVLEDDCLPRRRFHDFMDQCLDRYAGDERVMAVCGFRPIGTDLDKALKDYPYDAFMFPRPNPCGWATWRRAWKHYVGEGDFAAKYAEAAESGVAPDLAGESTWHRVRQKLGNPDLDVWTPGWLLAFILANGLAVYPRGTLIYNTEANLGPIPEWNVTKELFTLPDMGLHPPIHRMLLDWLRLGTADGN